jgi:hypothetical protein
LDWNSVYNSPQNLKRKREGDEDGDLRLPSWTNLATDAHRRKIQVVAKKSLKRAEHEQRLLKGKGKADDQPRKANWNLICVNGECAYSRLFNFTSADDYMEHQRSFCHYPDEELEKMRPEIVDFFNSGLESELMKTKKVLLESDFRELLIGRE